VHSMILWGPPGMARRYLLWWVSTGTALVGVNLG